VEKEAVARGTPDRFEIMQFSASKVTLSNSLAIPRTETRLMPSFGAYKTFRKVRRPSATVP
jgi:hypothetical protein